MDAQRITPGTQLIGTIPPALGYVPRDSLVLVTVEVAPGGREGVVGPSLRFDFGPLDVRDFTATAARNCLEQVRTLTRADMIHPVVFSDPVARFHLDWDERDPAHDEELGFIDVVSDALRRLRVVLEDSGYRVQDALWAGCSATGGLRRPEMTERNVDLASAGPPQSGGGPGVAVAASFEDSVRLPEPDAGLRAAVEALRREAFTDGECADGLLAEALLLEARALMREEFLPPEDVLVPDPLAVLAVERLCDRGRDRDIIQLLLSGDHPDFDPWSLRDLAPGEFLGYARGILADGTAAAQAAGLSPHPPRQASLAESIEWLRRCAELVGAEARADVLALLAWFEWARGRMSFAQHYAECACEEQEDHRLAGMLRTAAGTGMPPRWLREL